MRKSLLAIAVVSMFAVSASADHKPGQYTGVRKCTGSSGGIDVDVTSKKTIGVATCKAELGKEFVAKGMCSGKKKGAKVEYTFTFGDDKDPDQTKGAFFVLCR